MRVILSQQTSASKYNMSSLYDKITGKKHHYCVHQLIAHTFVKNNDPENNTIVNHKDRNRTNNNPKNLEWTTIKENNIHGRGHKIKMIDPGTNIIIERFRCIADARIFLNIKGNDTIINEICKGIRTNNIYRGYKWKYDNE